MNRAEFNELTEKKLEECKRVLGLKAANYAHSAITEDRLNNFKIAADLQRTTAEAALGGMLSKHIVAIFDLIKILDREPLIMAEWDEKITDSINYLLLLWALVNERKGISLPYYIVDPSKVNMEELKDMSPGELFRAMKSKGVEPLFSSTAPKSDLYEKVNRNQVLWDEMNKDEEKT